MKLCKKLAAAILAVCLLAMCLPAVGADLPELPEVPEGYDGYVTVGVSAIMMGWGYLMEPILVPFHEGECVAEVTIRALDMCNMGYYYSTSSTGDDYEGFYLIGISCEETEPNIPDYIMEQFEIYPEWAMENIGYTMGEWTGVYEDDGELDGGEYSTFSGWMYLDNDESPWDGADERIVSEGHVYTWFFTVYGWGMDYGVSDGWGSFPLFDNPMTGVSRVEISSFISIVNGDEELAALVEENASAEYEALLEAFIDTTSSQEELDALLAAVLAALGMQSYEPGDVNMDGEVNTEDALLVMRYGMGLLSEDDIAIEYADYNGDGVVDLSDALLIFRATL